VAVNRKQVHPASVLLPFVKLNMFLAIFGSVIFTLLSNMKISANLAWHVLVLTLGMPEFHLAAMVQS